MSNLIKKNPNQNKTTFYVLISVIVGLTLIYQLRPILSDEEFMWISVPSYSIIPGLLTASAAIFAFKLSKINHYQAKAFLFFAIGAGCWFIAEQIWAIHDHIFDQDPFPSEADIFFLLAYPFYFLFLYILLKSIWSTVSKKIVFISIILSVALLFPTISYTLLDYQDDLSLEFFIAVAYPILSSILLVQVIIGIFYLFKKKANYSWMLLLFGFITYSVADTIFLFTVLGDSYYDGHPVDLLYLYGIILLTFSVIEKTRNFDKNKSMDDLTPSSEQIRYETINNFGIPLVIIILLTTVLVSALSTIIHNTLTDASVLLLIGIITLLAVFSAIIFILNSNLNKLVKLRTSELENQRETLEKLVEEKTQEVLNSEKLSAIGELSGRLAHDLRTPLSVMRMAIDLLKQKSADVDLSSNYVTSRLNLIEKSIDRISYQVDDVLGFVRNAPLKLSTSSLRNSILSSINKVKVPTNIKVTVSSDDVHADFDTAKFDAVFINIITNAIQAMPDGGEINIDIKSKGSDAIIEFENTGEPIPNELLSKIFEPLFTTKQQGTGLGLSSCKNIVEQHGGKLTVKNNPTTFSIIIPKKQDQISQLKNT